VTHCLCHGMVQKVEEEHDEEEEKKEEEELAV
jgi:hypothetical protein